MNIKEKTLKPWQRLLLGLGMPALAAAACIFVYKGGRLRCVFYELTRLYCPGCGSGRALLHIFAGDFYAAFRSNILLFILGPPALAVLLHEYLRLVLPSLGLKPVFLSNRLCFGCLFLVFAFWILRNIPLFAFLAP